ncbi:hypothetical protein GCM10011609_22070 [Lentzea pudingi]|uniref:Uncharacterized protein n=1 Tax=Lentzea pudingi TaxID=1789439 RepID=A0ABQ2HND5_9PSEU|nr:hypothetical protein GCM10011609_22070 [Lentzea pudingi]
MSLICPYRPSCVPSRAGSSWSRSWAITGRLAGQEFGSTAEAYRRLRDMTFKVDTRPSMAQARSDRERACITVTSHELKVDVG